MLGFSLFKMGSYLEDDSSFISNIPVAMDITVAVVYSVFGKYWHPTLGSGEYASCRPAYTTNTGSTSPPPSLPQRDTIRTTQGEAYMHECLSSLLLNIGLHFHSEISDALLHTYNRYITCNNI